MRPPWIPLVLIIVLAGCSAGDTARAVRIAVSGDAAGAGVMAAEKAARYAADPQSLEHDIKAFTARLEAFRKAIADIWGDEDTREPQPTVYVKYTQNYKSRAVVDFDTGLIEVETVDEADPLASLKSAIVTTLLTPNDPRAVDLFSAGEIKLGETPFLLGQVKDYEDKDIRWAWRAERFADTLMERSLQVREVDGESGALTAHGVRFSMVKDHLQVRARKFAPLVAAQAQHFGVSRNLIYAVTKTESDFNPFATSAAPAFGLMQIVPRSAGAEVRKYLTGKDEQPSKDFLYDPVNNVQYGTAYLHLLETRYLGKIADPVSREYCVISAYNTGPGNLLRTFSKDRDKAVRTINSMPPLKVYETLRAKLPYEETRRYLYKVTHAKKLFVGL